VPAFFRSAKFLFYLDLELRGKDIEPFRGNYSDTSNNMKLVHWQLMGGLLHWYSKEGTGRGRSPPKLLAVPNVTAHPSTASVPITVSLYNGPLLCGFNVPIKD